MRRCGKRYATLDLAQRSKAGSQESAESGACPFGCGGFHVRKAPSAPSPAKADRARSPQGSVKAAVRLVLAGQLTVAQAARVTGANPESVEAAAWREAKRLVMERDSYTCLATGGRAADVHHRVPRGMGGTADPRIAFGLANLVSLTRAAHDLAHKADNPEMAVRGFRLERWQDPALEPLLLFGEHGGATAWLTAGGEYATSCPEKAGAA
jgi:hypothetical protein